MDFRRIRVNQNIRAREVRVIDEEGRQLGVMQSQAALQRAQEKELDLVEISPQANPPVCKIIDFSKYKYITEKREKEARKHQRLTEIKEIQIRPSIADHDLQIKLNHILEFLADGHSTKIVMRFFGRAQEFMKETSQRLMEKIKLALVQSGTIEPPHVERNRIIFMVLPKKK